MPTARNANEQGARVRRASYGQAILASVSGMLLLAYLGNAAWNLLHLHFYDGAHLLTAMTLPFPLVAHPLSIWVELASGALFLLLLVLTVSSLSAARRRLRHRNTTLFAEADQADIFIADTSRTAHRLSPIPPSGSPGPGGSD